MARYGGPSSDIISPVEAEALLAARENKLRAENTYHAGAVGFEACFNKILVLEDDFRSGYECPTCKGLEKLACVECENGHSKLNADIKCKACSGTQKITCPTCSGKGASIIIPETAKRRPTTGTVVSKGIECTTLSLGDKVMYPSFCGEVLELNGRDVEGNDLEIVCRLLRESEILCRVTGDLELRRGYKYDNQTSG